MLKCGEEDTISAQHAVDFGLGLLDDVGVVEYGDEEPEDASRGVVCTSLKCGASDWRY